MKKEVCTDTLRQGQTAISTEPHQNIDQEIRLMWTSDIFDGYWASMQPPIYSLNYCAIMFGEN